MFSQRYQHLDPSSVARPQGSAVAERIFALAGPTAYTPHFVKFPAEWKRPDVNWSLVRHGGTFTCMLTDITYSSTADRPIIELHGVNEDGNSVFVNCFNFLANFYVGTKTGAFKLGAAAAAPSLKAPVFVPT